MKYKYYVVCLVVIDGHNATVGTFVDTTFPLDTQENLETTSDNIKTNNGFESVLILNIIELKG